MDRYAVVNKAGLVLGTPLWDGLTRPRDESGADIWKARKHTPVLIPEDLPVEEGWTWDGEEFSPPAGFDLDAYKKAAVATLRASELDALVEARIADRKAAIESAQTVQDAAAAKLAAKGV